VCFVFLCSCDGVSKLFVFCLFDCEMTSCAVCAVCVYMLQDETDDIVDDLPVPTDKVINTKSQLVVF